MDAAPLRFGRFRFDRARRVLLDDGQPVRLGARALDLLAVLADHPDRVVGKDELFAEVWPGRVVEENNLQQHISALRKALGPEAIVTVPGRGYKFTLAPGDDPAPAPPAAPPPDPAAAVPNPGPLFGRDDEVAGLRARVAAHDLVTVVGPGGIGKTRLAWAVARADAGSWSGGVWVVDLAVLDHSARVPEAVAQTLGIVLPPPEGAALATVVASALRRQHLLLLLDNCEHVLDGVAGLVDALRRLAPGVHVLATSQEPLRLDGEQVVRLAPLPPDAAVRLFLARAAAADWRFAPGHAEIAAVGEICNRLDGLPLAIELAAARLPLIGLQGLHARLDESLRLLGGGPSRAPARQQTLRAALAWSHGLLSDAEQALFRRLAVFSGGFSVDLAERALAGDGLEPWELLDRLGVLVDKSLVLPDTQPVTRCRLLEPARAYGLEQLHAAGEATALRLRHAAALAALLQELDRDVPRGPRHDLLLRPVQAEMDNLRSAMRWLAAAGTGSTDAPPAVVAEARRLALTLAAHADWLWAEGDPQGEGFRFCALARDWLDDDVPPALACRLRLAFQGQARTRWMPAARWIDDARAALDGARVLGDRVGLYRALCALGRAPRSVIGHAEAGALLAEAAQVEDPAWSPRLRMTRQVALEWWYDLDGRLDACRDAGRSGLALAREAGSVRSEIGALGNLADTEWALGRPDESIALSRQAIALAAAHAMPGAALHVYANMVPALLARGEWQAAEDAVLAGREVMVRSIGTAFELLLPAALLAVQKGRLPAAAMLLGCADRLYADRGDEPHPPERRMRDAVLARLGSGLPAAERDALRAQGAAWGEDEAFEHAGLRASDAPR